MSDASNDPIDPGALSGLAPELASTMARVASDIALVIDSDGVIRSVAEGTAPLSASCAAWVGQHFGDTVTADTRAKIERLLDEVRTSGVSRRREVNHPGPVGAGDIPVSWAAIRLGAGGPVVAVGRDLRAVAAIQQRFVDAQQEMERDYWRRRQAESRYRLLFQVASDAVFVLDAATLQVLDANEAATALLGTAAGMLVGRPLPECVPTPARPALTALLAGVRSTGRAGETRIRAMAGDDAADIAATPFKAGDVPQLLVRARRGDSADTAASTPVAVADFVEQTPDAVVITDSAGRIQFANPAFLILVRQSHEAQLAGRLLPELLGDADGLWGALLARTRSQGIVPRAPLTVRLADAAPLPVEATSALMADGEQECVGFTLRPAAHATPAAHTEELLRGLGELTGQLGRAPLADLLAEVGRLAEKHLIERAIARAGGLTSVTAELLGLTPESLAACMRRHGLQPLVYDGPDGPSRAIN